MLFFIILISAYLLGSVPFGPLLVKKKNIDLAKTGSGNIGATNVVRAAGWRMGLRVFLLDVLKGAIPAYVSWHLLAFPIWQVVIVGIVTVIGHLFPIFLKFKGGKGVSTAVGVFFVLNSLATGSALVIFIIVYALTKYVSAGSLLGTLAVFIIQLTTTSAPWGSNELPITILSLTLLIVISYTHRANIVRLLSGKENKTKLKKKVLV